MVARFIDPALQEQPKDQLDKELGEAVTQRVTSNLPAKYAGKSVEDIVKMHEEAEKVIGRQGGELGELRRIADESLKREALSRQAAPVQQSTPEPKKDNAGEFFSNPEEAVRKAVAQSPEVRALQQSNEQARQQAALNKLNAKHPDLGAITASPEFVEFIKASPVRQRMFAQSHQNFDLELGDELISTFKALHPAKQAETNQQTTDVTTPKTEPKQFSGATLPRGTVPTEEGTQEQKKIYRRADLRNLRIRDPKRYMEMSDEITRAYVEGRVK